MLGWDVEAEARAVGAAAQGFLDAWRAKDAEAMRRWGEARSPDPVLVLRAMHSSHVRASLASPPGSTDYGEAARAFAQATRGNPAARGVQEIAAAWATYDREDLERDARLRDAWERLARRDDAASCAADLEAIARVEADVGRARASLRGAYLLFERLRSLEVLGRFPAAIEAGRAAAAYAAAIPWPTGEARAWRGVAVSGRAAGDLPAALDALRRAAAIHRDLSDRRTAGRLERARASLLRQGGRLAEALEAAVAAEDDAQASGDRGDEARARVARAHALSALGRREEADPLARDAAVLAEQAGDADAVVDAWNTVGTIAAERDRFADALVALDRAARAAEALGSPLHASSAWTNLGVVHRRMRRFDAAVADQRRALERAEAARNPGLVALVKGNLGIALAEVGDPAFRETLEDALADKRRLRDRVGAAETLLSLGRSLSRDPVTAEEGLRRIREALGEFEALRDPARLATANDALGGALERLGDLPAALAARRRAADLFDGIGDRSGRMADVWDGISRLERAAGRPERAVAAARRGVDLRRSLAAGLDEADAAGLVERARSSSDAGAEAAEALRPTDPAAAAEAAFDVIEGGRAVLLASGIVNAQALLAAEVPPDALAREGEARARVDGARRRLVALAYAATPDPAAVAAARSDLDGAFRAHGEAIARIRREASRAAGVVFPSCVALPAFRASLAKDEAFVAWQVTAHRTLAVVVRADGARLVPLGPADGLAAHAEAYVRLASTPGADDAVLAASLYDRLLRPLEADLEGVTRLLLAPDGPLAFVPFEALLRVEGDRRERLLRRFEMAYVPSATVLAALLAEARAAEPGRGFVGLGDPDYAATATGTAGASRAGLDALPSSREEVLAVAALFPEAERTVLLGSRATAKALLAAMPPAPRRLRAIHLAAHAFVDPERPRLTALVLAGGEALDLDAIHRLRVPADVAVLSACSTARGALLRGEGVLGFVRGFFFAGVPRVVASDWVVSDAGAASLVVAFHEGMGKRGLPPAAALRAAKLAALDAGGPAAHPSAWAGFVLWGLPR